MYMIKIPGFPTSSYFSVDGKVVVDNVFGNKEWWRLVSLAYSFEGQHLKLWV